MIMTHLGVIPTSTDYENALLVKESAEAAGATEYADASGRVIDAYRGRYRTSIGVIAMINEAYHDVIEPMFYTEGD